MNAARPEPRAAAARAPRDRAAARARRGLGARAARLAALAALARPAALAAALGAALAPPTGCARTPEGELFGVRLGLSAGDTRARFRPAGEGSWVMRPAPAPALEWSAATPDAVPRRASFEFHQGMLVAARYELPGGAPAAEGRPLEVTPATVVSRQPAEGGGVRVVVLSRSCPDHADEVRRLLGGAPGS